MVNEDRSQSDREKVARELGHFCSQSFVGPYNGYQGKVSRTSGKPHRVAFSQNRCLDGMILVYGKSFIFMKYQTSYQDLPRDDTRVFESVEHAREFLEEAFVNLNFDKALDVPVKD